jgi:glycosyltransferase involved in cell wall biosynthesis
MTQFALPAKWYTAETGKNNGHNKPVLVFDAHNAVWTILDRMHRNAPWFFKPVLNLETRRVKRYEGQILHAYDHTLAVTEIDRMALLEAAALSVNDESANTPDVSVIPIAVNTQELKLVDRPKNSTNILTLGTLHYPPNADGIRWFLQEVFPLIQKQAPAATLTIIGKNPPKDFQQSASQAPESISVTGYVPKLTPYMEKAALMVIPVRAGGGMRVRILEAFARGIPVVTTTVGLEGIDASIGEDVLVADSPDDFAQAVLQLLQNPSLQSKLVQNGRQLAKKRYDWQVVLKKLDKIYGGANFVTS